MNKNHKLLLYSISFIAGVFFYNFVEIEKWLILFLIGILISLFFSFKSEKTRIFLACLMFFITAFLRVNIENKPIESIELEKYTQNEIAIETEVLDIKKDYDDKNQLILLVRDKSFPENTKILAYLFSYQDLNIGDIVEIKSKLKIPENFNEFDYKKYLFSQNIYFISYYPQIKKLSNSDSFFSKINIIRFDISESFSKIMPANEASVLSAMVLGIKSSVSEQVLEKFNKTGTRHIIAVSGAHLVIIISILMFLLLELGVNRNQAFYLLIISIISFIIMTGLASSTIRAGIMASIILFAIKIGRLGKSLGALILTCAIMLFLNPKTLSDVGFQLSFLATLGIIVIFPYFKKIFGKLPEIGGIKDILLVTISAQIAILPVIVENFESMSLLSVFANIMILPVLPIIMIGGYSLVIAISLNFYLAKIIAFPVYLLIKYQIAVIDFFANLDFGLIEF